MYILSPLASSWITRCLFFPQMGLRAYKPLFSSPGQWLKQPFPPFSEVCLAGRSLSAPRPTPPCATASASQPWAQHKTQQSQGQGFYQFPWAQLLPDLIWKIYGCIWPLAIASSLLGTDTNEDFVLLNLHLCFQMCTQASVSEHSSCWFRHWEQNWRD